MTRASHRRTSAEGVTKKLATRGVKTPTKKKLGLKLLYCAPERYKVTNMPRGQQASLEWDETGQRWTATVRGVVHPLTTFFSSPAKAKEDPAKFEREAIPFLERIMSEGPRPVAEQKGPLAIGVRS